MPQLEFTLPLRTSKPSVILQPSFTLLYEGKPESLTQFLETNAPIPIDDLLKNDDFVSHLISQEPGPKFQYENIRPALSAMRCWFLTSDSGKKLMAFYKDFLQLHGRWLMAVAELTASQIHNKMTEALYITQDDKKLLAHFQQHLPKNFDLHAKISSFPALTLEQFREITTTTTQPLIAKARDLSKKIFDLKSSDEMWKTHGTLLKCMEVYEKKLMSLRDREAEHRARVHRARNRTRSNTQSQMGNAGAAVLEPHVIAAVKDFVTEEQEKYFNFDGGQQH